MTSPSETAVNGTKNNHADTAKTSSSPTPQTAPRPKQNGINGSANANGHAPENGTSVSKGEGSAASTDNHLHTITPASSQADIMEQIPSGDSQQGQSDQEDQSEGDNAERKRDLYVGNLHPRVQLEMLKNVFGGDAWVENVKIVPDRNLSHGGLAYGFVTMRTRELAESVLDALQNTPFFGLEMRINWATPTKSAEHGLSVFVGDISPEVTVEDLQNAFRDETNSVVDARIVMDPNSGRTKGYGFVTFKDQEAAQRALSKSGEILKGRKMRVNWASTTKDQKPTPPQMMSPQDMYAQPIIPGMMPGNEFQLRLVGMAQYEGLDARWYSGLPMELQAGIVRISNEAPSAKVMWVGNLDKTCTQHDLMPLFTNYGLIEEITMVGAHGYAFVSFASHLVAATLIVIFKDHVLKGRKMRTGWSHSSQRQLQQQAVQAVAPFPQPQTSAMISPMPTQRSAPAYQMAPMPQIAPTGYMYPQQPMLYNPYMQPMHPYPQVVHPIHPVNGSSTPRSANSGSATPSNQESKTKETPSPR